MPINAKLTDTMRSNMTELILITEKIIQTEGLDAVSIRKLARESGKNSALIYHYFDNLDHLIIYSSLQILQEYTNDLDQLIRAYPRNKEELFFSIWACFCDHAFKNPLVYKKLFFNRLSTSLDVLFQDYFLLFPDRFLLHDKQVRNFVQMSNLIERNYNFALYYLGTRLNKENCLEFSKAAVILFRGMLSRVLLTDGKINLLESRREFIRFLKSLYKGYR